MTDDPGVPLPGDPAEEGGIDVPNDPVLEDPEAETPAGKEPE